jgi:hypothetical protein
MSEYISSPEIFKSGMESSFWRDIDKEMDRWLDDIHEALELGVYIDDSGKSVEISERRLFQLQGSAEAVRKFKQLPHVILDNILEDNEREK